MTGMVLSGGEASEPFEIANGVKQGWVLAPVLFNLFFTCVLSHLPETEDGVYIRYRIDGSLFDLSRLNAKTKTIEKLILEALFVLHPACSASPSVLAKQKCCSSPALSYLAAIHPSPSREQR
ncbi:hypothetical protein ACOMHN_027567 [Nucella lapillus]